MLKRLSFLLAMIALALIIGFSATTPNVTQAQSAWTAVFYNNTNFTPPNAASTSYANLNINWGAGAPTLADGVTPIPGVGADNFSVVFTRTQNFSAGTFDFTLVADDQATLRLTLPNGVQQDILTVSNGSGTQQVIFQGAGTVTLEVRFIEFGGGANVSLTYPGSDTGVPGGQPPGVVFTPTPTPTATITPLPTLIPGLVTATVIDAAVLNVRDAPSLGGNRIGRILRGQTYSVVGRDADARWFLLSLGGYQGWAYGFYLFIDGNEFNPPIVSGNALITIPGIEDYGVRGQTDAIVRLRAEPNTLSTQIGRITWGGFLPIVGRTADGNWYRVVWKGTVGWAFASFINILEGDINNVPVIQ